MKQNLEAREIEKQGDELRLELQDHARRVAQLINLVPDERALFEAQRRAIAIGVMMMDLSALDPDHFSLVWPKVEREVHEAQGACNLLRLRIGMPMVRACILSESRN